MFQDLFEFGRRAARLRRLVVFLVVGLVGLLVGPAALLEASPASAAAVTSGACIEPITPTTVLDTAASRRKLLSGTPQTATLPATVPSDAGAVMLLVRGQSQSSGDVVVAPLSRGGERTTAARAASKWSTSTVLVSLPTSSLAVTYQGPSGKTADATVQVTGFIPNSGCFTPHTPTALLDSSSGVGVPTIGMLAPNSTTAVDFSTVLPDPVGSPALSWRLGAGSTSTRVDLIERRPSGDEVVASRTIAAGDVVSATELLPPATTRQYVINVSNGPAHVQLGTPGWFTNANAYAQTSDQLVDTATGLGAPRAPLSSGGQLDIAIPSGLSTASAVAISVTMTARQDSSMVLWPTGDTRPSLPTVQVAKGRQILQTVVIPPGAKQSISVRGLSGSADIALSASGWSPIPPPLNQPVPGVTILPTPADVSGMASDPSTGAASVVYAGSASVDPGDVMVVPPTSENPDGYLGVVTDVASPAASAASGPMSTAATSGELVTLRQATLLDALPSADMDSGTAPLDSGEAPPITEDPLPPDVPPSGTGEAAPAAAGMTQSSIAAASTGGSLPGSAQVGCSAGVVAKVSSSLRVQGGLNLSASWRPFKGVTADFGFDGGLTGSVSLSAAAAATCSASATLPGPALPTITFFVGPVPVVVRPELSMSVKVTGTVGGSFLASAGVNIGLATGVRYASGSFTPYFTPRASFPVTVDARAGASAEVEIVPRLTLKVYGVAGPYAEIGAFAKGTVNLLGSPWWTAEAGVRAGVGLQLDVWLVHAQFDAGRRELMRFAAGSAAGSYPGPSISTTGLPGGQVGVSYSASLQASGGQPPYSWYLVSGRVPAGLRLSTNGVISGTPTVVEGTSFTVRVIGANGYRSPTDRSLSISIGNAPTPNPPPNPDPPPASTSVTLAKGASAQGQPGCSSSYCRFMNVSASGFPANTTVTIVCRGSNGDEGGFYTYTRKTDGSGASFSAVCYYGFPGRYAWVTVNGVESNRVLW